MPFLSIDLITVGLTELTERKNESTLELTLDATTILACRRNAGLIYRSRRIVLVVSNHISV
jgi:hypothetical protein